MGKNLWHSHFHSMSEVTTSKKKNKNQRRFNDEQVKSLELIFESESKLEPKKKLEVARELGMQPRQVAIWFQNKRARWKSKQLEHDYSILQANFNNLASKLESLKKEKQALVIQFQKLNDRLTKPKEEGGQVAAMNNIDKDSDKGDADKPGDDSAIKTCYLRNEEEHDLISMVEAADGSLTYPQDLGSFDSAVLFDQSSSGYQWWDFWC